MPEFEPCGLHFLVPALVTAAGQVTLATSTAGFDGMHDLNAGNLDGTEDGRQQGVRGLGHPRTGPSGKKNFDP